MNERIKELAEQAWRATSDEVAHLNRMHNRSYSQDEITDIFEIKFAELIVRECADILRAESERLYRLSAEEKDELFASNFEICAEKCVDNEVAIKEHFGVE